MKLSFKIMKLDQLDGLMAFWKVAHHKGFSAAAAELEVSPSALSQAIRQLESRLGVRLLNRTTRSVALTEAGEAYLARVGPALVEVLEASERLNTYRNRPSGVLRLNAARVSTAMVLRPLLPGFLAANPEVEVEVASDDGYVDIVERRFDAGIRMGESVQRDMIGVPLGGPLEIAIIASPAYLKKHKVPRVPAHLADHNCVRFRFQASGTIFKWELLVGGRIVEHEIAGNLTVSDTGYMLDAALDGIGLVYTFERFARPWLQSKRLTRVMREHSPTFAGFHLYYPNRRHTAPKLQAFIDYARRFKW